MIQVPDEPVAYIVIGLAVLGFVVLLSPFLIKKVEENLELFFLLMGVCAVTISGLWSPFIIIEALKAPVIIGDIPIGIFQAVLFFGLLLHFFNKPVYKGILSITNRVNSRIFVFCMIVILGLISSIISVIITSCILAAIMEALPIDKNNKIKIVVITCFAIGLGAGLTPVGEPLSTICIYKLTSAPYYADFFFLVRHLGIYIIPGIFAVAIFGSLYIGPKIKFTSKNEMPAYSENLKTVFIRSIKVYIFVAAIMLLGEGFKPLITWYFSGIHAGILYWINIISSIFDNATLTAIEIGPSLSMSQIISILMSLLIAGGIFIPGNIPNIVVSGTLKINMREWARIGLPVGLALMVIYFLVLIPSFL